LLLILLVKTTPTIEMTLTFWIRFPLTTDHMELPAPSQQQMCMLELKKPGLSGIGSPATPPKEY